MFSRKQAKELAVLFLAVNVINLVLLIFRSSGFAVNRPFFIYDYLLLIICIALRLPSFLTLALFVSIAMLDVIITVSGNFLFDPTDFGRNFEFLYLYKFTMGHYIGVLLALGMIICVYIALEKVRSSEIRFRIKPVLMSLAVVAFLIYALDSLNGRTFFFRERIIALSKFNISGSALVDLALALNAYSKEIKSPAKIDQSVTFKTFADDSVSNQLFVLVESWGLPVSDANRDEVNEHLNQVAFTNGWRCTFGSTRFRGSTYHAELRELLNAYGDFRFFVNVDSAKNFTSIFDIKKRQGYSTSGTHSFSSGMFQRKVWWKNIGIDNTFFLEDALLRQNVKVSDLDSGTPFVALADEEAFKLLIKNLPPHGRHFDYFLTVNSHLPFNGKPKNPGARLSFTGEMSEEASSQIDRIVELIEFIIQELNRGEWSKVLIMGDHMPPYPRLKDRDFYSESNVPYVVLEREDASGILRVD